MTKPLREFPDDAREFILAGIDLTPTTLEHLETGALTFDFDKQAVVLDQ